MDKHHILVVDDNHINRLFFESSLKKLDLRVSTAENGFVALQLCRQCHYDLILMDIRMDGIDGIETAAQIKNVTSHQHTPILAISAERFDHHQHDQFVSSVLKPVSQENLKNTLAMYLPKVYTDVSETRFFDQATALEISHHDASIVEKLRMMLVSQLPEDWQQIESLYKQKKFQSLDAYLHKVLGSAKVCAAKPLVQSIEQLKNSIDQQQENKDTLQNLKKVINQTITASNNTTS